MVFVRSVLMLIIGGMGIFPGAFLGGFIIFFLNELLHPLESYCFLIFGAIVVVAIKYMPEGIFGNIDFFKKLIRKILFRKTALSE